MVFQGPAVAEVNENVTFWWSFCGSVFLNALLNGFGQLFGPHFKRFFQFKNNAKNGAVPNLIVFGFVTPDGPRHPPTRLPPDRVFPRTPFPLASQEFVNSPWKLPAASLRDWPLPVKMRKRAADESARQNS